MIPQHKATSGLGPYNSEALDTDLVDTLEQFAQEKTRVNIRYLDHTGTETQLNGVIGEVYTESHAEFLRMDDQRTLRLDQILEAAPHERAAETNAIRQLRTPGAA